MVFLILCDLKIHNQSKRLSYTAVFFSDLAVEWGVKCRGGGEGVGFLSGFFWLVVVFSACFLSLIKVQAFCST